MDNKSFIEKINQINLDFYKKNANSFSKTRQHYWKGWIPFINFIRTQIFFVEEFPLKILDVGCGNGRLAKFIFEKSQFKCKAISYLGLDFSKDLFKSNNIKKNCVRFKEIDILKSDFTFGKFQMIFMLALLHHIPGKSTRFTLIKKVAPKLDRRGLFILSLWQFKKSQRILDVKFDRKIKQKYFLEQLDKFETNDHFLNWQNSGTPRFCHHFDEEEITEIKEILRKDEFKLVLEYEADGKENLNRYLVFSTK